MEIAKLFQPINTEIKKATSFVAASALHEGEKYSLFDRLGERGGDARRWLEVMAGLDKQGLYDGLRHEISLVDD